jgi:hypothetical protein
LDSVLTRDLLLAHEEIPQEDEHHEEHDHDDHTSEEQAEEFGWGLARQVEFPYARGISFGIRL